MLKIITLVVTTQGRDTLNEILASYYSVTHGLTVITDYFSLISIIIEHRPLLEVPFARGSK